MIMHDIMKWTTYWNAGWFRTELLRIIDDDCAHSQDTTDATRSRRDCAIDGKMEEDGRVGHIYRMRLC